MPSSSTPPSNNHNPHESSPATKSPSPTHNLHHHNNDTSSTYTISMSNNHNNINTRHPYQHPTNMNNNNIDTMSNHELNHPQRKYQSTALHQEMNQLVPGFWKNSQNIIIRCVTWISYAFIIPFMVLPYVSKHSNHLQHSLSPSPSSLSSILHSLRYLMPSTGILYILYILSPLLQKQPPIPTDKKPFIHSHDRVVKVKYVLIICNRHSGKGDVEKQLNDIILPMLQNAQIKYEIQYTQYSKYAVKIGRTLDATSQFDAVLICGGDGVFSEFVNGMLTRHDQYSIPISLIPLGSGNSLAADLGSWNVKQCTQRLIDGYIYKMDVNKITDDSELLHYSTNEISFAAVGETAVLAENAIFRKVLGQSRYDILAVWVVLKYMTHRFHCRLDNSEEISGNTNVAFINLTQHFGKGLRSSPYAKLDDSKLDVVFLRNASRMEMIRLFLLMPLGAHTTHAKVTYKQAQNVTIYEEGIQRAVCNVDGDNLLYNGTLRIECIPKAIEIFAPENCVGRNW